VKARDASSEMYDVEPLELPGAGRALFTTRAHGNLSSVGGERAEEGAVARERLREALGVRRLVRGYQVHGTVVGRVASDVSEPVPMEANGDSDEQRQPSFRADGHAIAAPRLAAMVLTADCVPVVLGAPGVVAAIHAGWRGLAAGVLEEGVRAVRELGGVEIVAIVGPCAGACCYEVGEEVHEAFGGAHRRDRSIDLRSIARERLSLAGVAEVRDVRACTICDERFFSHRREGVRAGRQAGVAWLS
jgi:purine-nucleoside/S-methyl-5'-thioadenosine phosphorylase / adenosine deaminase